MVFDHKIELDTSMFAPLYFGTCDLKTIMILKFLALVVFRNSEACDRRASTPPVSIHLFKK